MPFSEDFMIGKNRPLSIEPINIRLKNSPSKLIKSKESMKNLAIRPSALKIHLGSAEKKSHSKDRDLRPQSRMASIDLKFLNLPTKSAKNLPETSRRTSSKPKPLRLDLPKGISLQKLVPRLFSTRHGLQDTPRRKKIKEVPGFSNKTASPRCDYYKPDKFSKSRNRKDTATYLRPRFPCESHLTSRIAPSSSRSK